jgi:hypothetical protein
MNFEMDTLLTNLQTALDQPWLLPALLGVMLLTLSGAMTFLLREIRRLRQSVAAETQRLFEQLDLLRFDGRGAIEGMGGVEERLDRLATTLGEHRAADTLGPGSAYEIAGRLAATGASADQLAAVCRIGSAEAQLLVRLQAARGATVPRLSEPRASRSPSRR